jgi:hypothetical protein
LNVLQIEEFDDEAVILQQAAVYATIAIEGFNRG